MALSDRLFSTMTFIEILPYIQVVLVVLLTLGILLQRSSAGLGGAFGGSDDFASSFHTKRGFEKFLFFFTISVSILFAISAILAIILK